MKLLAVVVGVSLAVILEKVITASISTQAEVEDSVSTPDYGQIPGEEIITVGDYGIIDSVIETINSIEVAITMPIVKAFGTKYDAIIQQSAMQYGIDQDLLYKLLYQESHFREDIITGKKRSSAGALGIAQFMPATAVEELGSVEAALDPAQAIPGAARYLAKLIKSTGSTVAGVAAYNWGVGNVKRKGLAKAPAETQAYVKDILGVKIG